MTKREFWLKLFNENDTALASAIHFCERFVTEESLENGADFIEQKKKELYEEVPEELVIKVFGKQTPRCGDCLCRVCANENCFGCDACTRAVETEDDCVQEFVSYEED